MGVTRELPKLRRKMRGVFGIARMRPGQEEVMRSVLEGRDTLAVMPTGAGKSLCYQLPGLHLPGTTVVVSPLISLMKDQVDKLGDAGLEAAQLNSALTAGERRESLGHIEREESDFVFTTPERFVDPAFLETLGKNRIDFVVVDEAHCISEWGHDFRPAYLALGEAVRALGSPPVLALTATATSEVMRDIAKHLNLRDARVITTGIYRPNLRYEVARVTNELEKREGLVRLMRETGGTGIVYAATVKAVEALAEFFAGSEFEVAKYHGKLPARERKENQERFMAGGLKAMIATNAFGMGIDKPDIRFVAHYQMPGSLEAYYQESGRAGRDGEAARCVLLFQLEDRRTQQFFLGGSRPKFDDVLAVHNALLALGAHESPAELSAVQAGAATVAESKVRVVLSLLKELKLVRELRGARFRLARAGVSRGELEEAARRCEEMGERDREKLERMMLYGQSAACRWRLLHEYFDAPFEQARCGNCDNCLHPLDEQLGLNGKKDEPEPPQSSPQESSPQAQTVAAQGAGERKEGAREFAAGERVSVAAHGEGRVKAVDGDKLTIVFAGGETKIFKSEFVEPCGGGERRARSTRR
ncbi:MAG TPA: ATP-dependent DNA helicase RecQ [Pyrinomonadaceae bacterium]|jgi:ATP-dependent DNA helicase RecQ